MARRQGRSTWPAAGVFRCRDTVLLDGERAARPAVAANDRDGIQHPGHGWAGLAGSAQP